MQRLWDVLAAVVTPAQARMLELLLEVPDGARFSDLERLRNGPRTRSGKAIIERPESLQVDSARDTSAQVDARRLHHNWIGTEHLLLGLLD